MSYNDECSICIEEFTGNNIILSCNHKFHTECILKYIEIEFNKYRKQNQNEQICCQQLKCPLCRKSISCKDSNPLIYNYYQKYKKQYKQIKKEINKLQNEIYLFTFKFQVKKLFRKINQQDAYKFLLEDETLLETIMLHKEKYREIKYLMNTYKDIYYGRCRLCISPRQFIVQII
jgi:hypothetical protein